MRLLERIFPNVALCLYLFDKDASGPRANDISNAAREQSLSAVEQWVERQAP